MSATLRATSGDFLYRLRAKWRDGVFGRQRDFSGHAVQATCSHPRFEDSAVQTLEICKIYTFKWAAAEALPHQRASGVPGARDDFD